MTRLQTCSLIVLGSLIRCSTNSMSYPSYSHPPSSPSSFAPQGNSNYPTLVNSVPSAHCASALSLLACSMRAASGTMPMWVLQMGERLCWILLGWVRLVMFYSRTLINHLSCLSDKPTGFTPSRTQLLLLDLLIITLSAVVTTIAYEATYARAVTNAAIRATLDVTPSNTHAYTD